MVAIGRIARNFGRLLFDTNYQDVVTSSIKARKRLYKINKKSVFTDLHKNIGDAFVRAEKKTMKVPFWQSMKNSLKTINPDIINAWKNSKGFWGKLKGVGKQLGKRLPVIGAVATVLLELPNICSAFQDKGFLGGIAEIGKSGARLGGFMAGMAIGQALIPIPIVGGIVGGMLGDWLVSKVVGKSHSEEKAEAEQQAEDSTQTEENNTEATATAVPQLTPEQMAQMRQNLALLQQQMYGNTGAFNDDFMMNATGMNKMCSPMFMDNSMLGMNGSIFQNQRIKQMYP